MITLNEAEIIFSIDHEEDDQAHPPTARYGKITGQGRGQNG